MFIPLKGFIFLRAFLCRRKNRLFILVADDIFLIDVTETGTAMSQEFDIRRRR